MGIRMMLGLALGEFEVFGSLYGALRTVLKLLTSFVSISVLILLAA